MWNQIKTVLLLGGLSALMIGFGGAMGGNALVVFAGLAIVMNVGAYYFSDRLILSMHGAQEISEEEAPELHGMVAELATAANIPKPRVCVIPEAYANAFATGRNPKHGVVAVTQGILDLLSPRELRGVIAHEIAHIKNRDILIATIAAMLGSVVSYAANAIQFSALFGMGRSNDDEESPAGGGLLMAFVAPIVATLMQMAVSRSREYVADATAAELTGDPEALAMALKRLHEPHAQEQAQEMSPATASLFIVSPLFGLGGVMSWFSTHPPAEDRIEKLMAMPVRVEPARGDYHGWRRGLSRRKLVESI